MKKLLFILFINSPIYLFAQEINKDCGLQEYLNNRYNIEDDRLNNLPYSAILHIHIKGWGTATFINDHTLITARHLSKKTRKIDFYKNVFDNDKVQTLHVMLKKDDFRIIDFPEDDCPFYFISSDISFISLTVQGKQKLSILYADFIPLADYTMLNISPMTNINVSGYPVDQAESGNNASDILSTKTTSFNELLFDNDCSMGGYKLFTCSGDSGAPVWLNLNDKFYIIGIHHGGPERNTIFNKENRNSFAVITSKVLTFKLP